MSRISIYERELGGINQQLKNLEETQNEYAVSGEKHRMTIRQEIKDLSLKTEERFDEISKSLSEIQSAMSENRGGWKVIVFISGVTGVSTGALIKFLPILGMLK